MYKKTTLLALCTVFTLSSCAATSTVASSLTPAPIKAGIAFLSWFLKAQPTCRQASNNKMERVPKWVCKLPAAKSETGAYGVGIAPSGGSPGLQRRLAQSEGRLQIAAAIQTQIVGDMQREEVLEQALRQSSNGSINQRSVVSTSAVSDSFRQHAEGTIYGSRELESFQTPNGTIYVLMAITEKAQIRKSAENMIQIALNADTRDLLGCQQADQCFRASQELAKAMDGSATIDSNSAQALPTNLINQ